MEGKLYSVLIREGWTPEEVMRLAAFIQDRVESEAEAYNS